MSGFLLDAGTMDDEDIIALTRSWVEQAVIGLNLCPFANAVARKEQIEYRISHAREPEDLLQDLSLALQTLIDTPAERLDTLLLIHPWVLSDFLDFNDFVGLAEDMLEQIGLSGIVQIASFHPQYQFAGVAPDDVTNATNQSPFPTLHLLREDSLDRAIAAMPDTDQIVDQNLALMHRMGKAGLLELQNRIVESVRSSRKR
jgi:hypothetical protein